jgi:uncharacterized protein (DUF58 family)
MVYEGEKVDVTVELKNGGTKVEVLEIVDEIPEPLVTVAGSNHHVISMDPGEAFGFSYTLLPEVSGLFEFGPATITASDTQGIVVKRKKFDVTSVVKVFPKIQYLPKVDIRPKRTRNWPGEISARKPGVGLDFYSLREYALGDPLKRVNWKASSRSEHQLFTNQFMSELGGDAIIVLDARSVSEVGEPPDSILTYSVRAAAILAYRILRDRNRVGTIILGSTLEKVRPGFGKRQFDRILLALAKTKPGTVWEISSLGEYLSLFFSTMVQIVFVGPLIDDEALRAVADISTRGYQVLVISPSPIEIEEHNLRGSDDKVQKLAGTLLKTHRENNLHLLRKSAVVVDWNVYTPLSVALREATFIWNRKIK